MFLWKIFRLVFCRFVALEAVTFAGSIYSFQQEADVSDIDSLPSILQLLAEYSFPNEPVCHPESFHVHRDRGPA
jgi:hypothetical protein